MRAKHAAVVWMFERLGLDAALAGDLKTNVDRHLGPYLGSYFPS
jgi:hypothetical protein